MEFGNCSKKRGAHSEHDDLLSEASPYPYRASHAQGVLYEFLRLSYHSVYLYNVCIHMWSKQYVDTDKCVHATCEAVASRFALCISVLH